MVSVEASAASVVSRCDQCGDETALPARFCRQCGARLAIPAAIRPEVRKTVTVLFCDIADSTALAERVDPESVRRVMSLYFDEMRRVIERHGGTVEKFIGDAVMAVFGVPRLHEDDALRAVRSAHQMGEALGGVNEMLQSAWGITVEHRIGVNTGEVVAGEARATERLVTGDAVNVAARLEQHARPGQVLLGEATYRLVRDAVAAEPVEPLTVKGKAAALRAWRLDDVALDAPWLQRHLDSPIVGRDDRLAQLEQVFAASLAPGCRIVTVIGSPGVGKSRLIREFTTRIAGRARVTHGRCLSYGDGVTYFPIGLVLSDLARVVSTDTPEQARDRLTALLDEHDAGADGPRIAHVVAGAIGLVEGTAPTSEICWAVRRMLEVLAQHEPLVVVLDDIHWAERSLLDLIEHVAMFAADVPLTIVCVARPELLEDSPGWCSGIADSVRLTVDPLSVPHVQALLANLLEGSGLPASMHNRIIAAAEGNPLFVEELLRMLVDDGVITHTEQGWQATVELDTVAIPPGIGAILAARLERLGQGEREVAQRAAVIGREFHSDALDEMSGGVPSGSLSEVLRSLVAKQIISPVGTVFLGSDTFVFWHQLTRDTAYASCPKEVRATLHERFAGWMEDRAGARTAEHAEILGYHLEQAVRQLSDLGPLDAHGRGMAVRAGLWLATAGRRALARDDVSAAANLLERALGLAPATDPERAGLLRDLGTALVHRGRFEDADRVLAEAGVAAQSAGRTDLANLAHLDRQFIRLQTRPDEAVAELAQVTDEAFLAFTETADQVGLTRVWQLRAELHWMACSYGATTQALEHAVGHARRAGEKRDEAAITVWLASCLALGPTTVPEAIQRCDELLARGSGSRRVEAAVLTVLGYLHALAGQPAEARLLVLRGRQRHEELGLTFARAHWTVFSGMALLLAGDTEAAEAELRWGYDTLRSMGERAGLSTVAAYLARVLLVQERYAEAEELTAESEAQAASDDLASQIAWRAVRALCRAAVRDADEALALARTAVELAEGTDDLELLGFAHTALSRAIAARGDDVGAREEAERANAAYRAKGDLVSPAAHV